VDDQAHGHAQRRAVAEAAVAALALVEHRFAELVADVFQRGVAVVADDREHRLQRGMQALVGALRGLGVLLQEFAVRIDLDRQQEGHFKDGTALAEVLADALLLGERIAVACLGGRLGSGSRGHWIAASLESFRGISEPPVGSRWYCRHQHALSRYFRLKARYVVALALVAVSCNGQRPGALATSLRCIAMSAATQVPLTSPRRSPQRPRGPSSSSRLLPSTRLP